MSSRPEFQAPPEIFYNDKEARKYTSSSRIIKIQAELTERALELLALPKDGLPRLLLDIGCGSGLSGETVTENGHEWIGLDISSSMLNVALEREVEGDLLLADMGQSEKVLDWILFQGLGFRSGLIDGAISISAIQWLCNADKSSHNPKLRLECFARGARAVFQVYFESVEQRVLIFKSALEAGFIGSLVIDFPHSSKKKKEYLVLTCSPTVPKRKGDNSSGDEEDQTVCVSDTNRPRKKQRIMEKEKGREWILKKKEQMRRRGNVVPADTKYTARKRKPRF
ncbi:hypothetical protein CsatB_027364 [Cannabis sativa]|uniref:18S rRNA (Guanine-N(7))-methyltransferase n=1 Tax=Cannabis sativa TaxID=3483 RepID=A0A7J6ESM0_CANSA|nr:hypothetical protein F8388_001175 [Cannabis sativa]KAF4377048.1 hypothetical protein G4B88_023834 [Cannabis sativa]